MPGNHGVIKSDIKTLAYFRSGMWDEAEAIRLYDKWLAGTHTAALLRRGWGFPPPLPRPPRRRSNLGWDNTINKERPAREPIPSKEVSLSELKIRIDRATNYLQRKAAERENKTLARIGNLILAGLAIIIYFLIAIILKEVL